VSSELRFQGGGTSATLQLKRSPQARVMRLRVDARNGSVVLTLPPRASERKALQWAAGHRGWIEAALADVPHSTPLQAGADIPFHGEPHRIECSGGASRAVRVEPGRIWVGGPADGLEARLLRWLKQHARTVLERETREYAAKAGVSIARISIGDPLSRWGSCSSSGAIRFSWRLILAPEWVRRATVAHEVAHRVHMNHGAAFHALVEALLGWDPKPARQWLRREGAAIHRVGRRG
jgi:predicted metal-dependent hydrolase